MRANLTEQYVAAIYNAAWPVRELRRPHQQKRKAQAMRRLGLAARAALKASEDFGPLLYAIRDALTDRD